MFEAATVPQPQKMSYAEWSPQKDGLLHPTLRLVHFLRTLTAWCSSNCELLVVIDSAALSSTGLLCGAVNSYMHRRF